MTPYCGMLCQAATRGGAPIRHEQLSPVSLKGVVPGGRVQTFLDRDSGSVIHHTMDDHLFRHGYLQRQIVEENGKIYVRTFGEGNNEFPATWPPLTTSWYGQPLTMLRRESGRPFVRRHRRRLVKNGLAEARRASRMGRRTVASRSKDAANGDLRHKRTSAGLYAGCPLDALGDGASQLWSRHGQAGYVDSNDQSKHPAKRMVQACPSGR